MAVSNTCHTEQAPSSPAPASSFFVLEAVDDRADDRATVFLDGLAIVRESTADLSQMDVLPAVVISRSISKLKYFPCKSPTSSSRVQLQCILFRQGLQVLPVDLLFQTILPD
jgi:hypothetical protein